MQGVLIAQLFRLQRFSSQERYGLTYYDVAIPLSVSCHGMALLIAIVGAYRFWRQQSSITDGKVLAGGWELNSIGVMISLVSQRRSMFFFMLWLIILDCPCTVCARAGNYCWGERDAITVAYLQILNAVE